MSPMIRKQTQVVRLDGWWMWTRYLVICRSVTDQGKMVMWNIEILESRVLNRK